MTRSLRIAFAVGLGIACGVAPFLQGPMSAAAAAAAVSSSTPGDPYNLSPTSRTLAPVSVFITSGTVTSPTNILSGQATRLTGNGSSVTLDFGKEVGGIVTLGFAGSSDAGQSIGLAFTESSQYVGKNSDASNGGGGADGAVYTTVAGTGSYTMPTDKLRGGFRYLTLFLNSGGWVDVNQVSLNFTAAPGAGNPSAYPDYFYSNDSLLNQIWYAGAYTVQLNTIAPTQGRIWPAPASGWENNGTIGTGTEVLADGAKRDRTVWPGDMGISVPTAYVSTGDVLAVRNSLSTMYQSQQSSGELPYAGPEVNFLGSDTYHMWSLIGTSTYYLYSADKTWLDGIWSKYKLGVNFITAKIDGNGLLNVTGTGDWARGDQGGENIEANAMLYQVLTAGTTLAQIEGDTALATAYTGKAAALKTQINARLWDAAAGAYKDNPTSTLHPQDGNSLAVWYNVVPSHTQAQSIATVLRADWNTLGAQTPEWNNNISPFAGSMELYAHFAAGDDTNALDLIRREWGFMLNSPLGTKSTFWEGYTSAGTLDAYSGSYTSLAHGWSTGPTGALTSDVLGIQPTAAAGAAYQVVPHPGDLTHVEGTLAVATGKTIHVSYDHSATGAFSSVVDSSSNSGSTGVIAVPTFGQSRVISINGTTAWNGTAFTGAAGIAGADQDADYVYFRGVQPGSYTMGYPATGTTVQQLPGTWTQCAAESATCSFSGTMAIAYGANGFFTYATATDGTACSNAVFGDPAAGVAKICYVEAAPSTANVWSQCAGENGACAFTGAMTVAYGTNGSFNYVTATNGTACSNAVFGDPAVNTVKTCSLVAPPASATWVPCASENGTCTFTGTREVAFGVNGKYHYASFTGSIPCTDSVFGDPAFGTAKSCYFH